MPRDLSPFIPDAFPVPTLSREQKTLARSVSCSGEGVHQGCKVTLTLHPAADDHGIVFERGDHNGAHNRVPAKWDHVQASALRTQIVNAHGVEVCTIEHVMAALYISGIDNALVSLSGAEVPIMDGGSSFFLQLIEQAGVAASSAPRRFIKILKPVEVRKGSSFARFTPAETPQFAITVAYPQHGVAPQSFAFDVENDDFARDVASARTFGFQRDIEALRAKGLTLGGNLENALLIGLDGKPLNKGGYRFENELARHKLLDAIGDISLAGAVILGRFEGHLSGHALNNELLKALFADVSAFVRFETENGDHAIPAKNGLETVRPLVLA